MSESCRHFIGISTRRARDEHATRPKGPGGRGAGAEGPQPEGRGARGIAQSPRAAPRPTGPHPHKLGGREARARGGRVKAPTAEREERPARRQQRARTNFCPAPVAACPSRRELRVVRWPKRRGGLSRWGPFFFTAASPAAARCGAS